METLVRYGVEHVFIVPGGGAMQLNDAAGAQPGIDAICMLHEQAAAIAAEAYTKASGKLALSLELLPSASIRCEFFAKA